MLMEGVPTPHVRFRLRPYPWTPAVRAALLATGMAAVGLIAVWNEAALPLMLALLGCFAWFELWVRRSYFVEVRRWALIARRGNWGASVRYRDIDYLEVAGEDVIVSNHARQGYCEPRERLRLEDAQSFLLELEFRRHRGRLLDT